MAKQIIRSIRKGSVQWNEDGFNAGESRICGSDRKKRDSKQ